MKIIHFTLGKVNPDSSNGINRVIEGLAKYGNKEKKINVKVVCFKANQKEKRKDYARDGFQVIVFNSFLSVMGYFIKNKNNIDIVHMHNVWSVYNVFLSQIFLYISIPYIITIHAGLMDDRVKKSNYFAKLLFQFLFQKKHLDRANGLHAIAKEEVKKIKEFTSNQNIFLIPNGIDIESIKLPKYKHRNKKILLGYLGRLSKEKNIKGIIKALSLLDEDILKKIVLVIIGPKNNNYAVECIKLAKDLGLNKQIIFSDKVNSKDKWSKLSELDLYIQTSFSEGASLTILEALYSKLPAIISRSCNVSYLNDKRFLKIVEPEPIDIARGIYESVEDIQNFKKTGEEAHLFIKNYYNWGFLLSLLKLEYEKIIQKYSSRKFKK